MPSCHSKAEACTCDHLMFVNYLTAHHSASINMFRARPFAFGTYATLYFVLVQLLVSHCISEWI